MKYLDDSIFIMAVNISTLTINAPIEKVWAVVTQPDYVKQWQYGSELITDWNPDAPIRFRTAWEDKIFEQWGHVVEFDAPIRLSYKLFAPRPGLEDKPENYFLMTYVLTPLAEQTKLEIVQTDERTGAKQEEPQGEENPVLKMLKEVAEA
jgi:uncharacterized protein YndB with AHSA1/START domain